MVSWLLEARDESGMNEHMQELIDEFGKIYDENERICREKDSMRGLAGEDANSVVRDWAESPAGNRTEGNDDPLRTRKLAKNNDKGGGIWDPFHRDIQKTIHFSGYTGSLTEPPCASDTLWRIMDVPVPISPDQLFRMKDALFNNRDLKNGCAFTSVHYGGSVARPAPAAADDALEYYKCTRSDYVSDHEREECGDDGCEEPYGTGLNPYVGPVVSVTGPPSEAPAMLPRGMSGVWSGGRLILDLGRRFIANVHKFHAVSMDGTDVFKIERMLLPTSCCHPWLLACSCGQR